MTLPLRYFLFLFGVSCVFPGSAFGQDALHRDNYGLLWEITGNGLEKPSYVFGSMHVRNKAVFEFPDSLLISLRSVDAFAGEVHMDSAMQRIFEVYVGGEELVRPDSLRALTSTSETKEVEETEERAYDAGEFLEQLRQRRQLERKGKMATMLDAYLMEIARSEGKQLMGLENIDAHLSEPANNGELTDRYSFFTGSNTADLLSLYYEGDLAKIGDYVNQNQAAFAQFELIPRNYIMASSIERITSGQGLSLFAVVGAAHLPGKEGVLELLKQKGFQVRKVKPNFPDDPAPHFRNKAERFWPTTFGPQKTYRIATPLGVQYQHVEDVSEMYLSFDIGQGLSYTLLVNDMFPNDYKDFDQYFFEDDGYVIERKTPIVFNKRSGFQYELRKPGEEIEFFRARVFFENHRMYYLQVGAYEESTLAEHSDVERFFANMHWATTPERKWQLIQDTLGGFSLMLPRQFVYTASPTNDREDQDDQFDYLTHNYRAAFTEPDTWLWLQWNDLPAGDIIVEDSLYLTNLVLFLEEVLEVPLEARPLEEWNSCPSLFFTGAYGDDKQLRGRYILRGNRLYLLIQIGDKKLKAGKKFMPSFRFLPYAETALDHTEALAEGMIEIPFPRSPVIRKEDKQMLDYTATLSETRVFCADSLSGAAYEVDILEYSDLYGVTDTAAFWAERIKLFTSYNDTVVSEKPVLVAGKYPGRQLEMATKGTQLKHRAQLFVCGPYFIQQYVYGTRAYLEKRIVSDFFAEVKVDDARITAQPSIFESKADALIQSFASQEEDRLSAAYKALDITQSFAPRHLDQMTGRLLGTWPDLEIVSTIKQNLIAAIGEMDFPEKSHFFAGLFQQLPQGSKERAEVLYQLLQSPDEENLAAYFQLLRTDPDLQKEGGYRIFQPFFDDLSLFVSQFGAFKTMLETREENLYLWYLAEDALLQIPEECDLIRQAIPLFVQRGAERLDQWRYTKATEALDVYSQEARAPLFIFDFYRAAQLDSEEVFRQAKRLFERTDQDWGALQAARFLLESQQELSRRRLKKMLRSDNTYLKIIQLLNEFDQLSVLKKSAFDEMRIATTLLEKDLEHGGVLVISVEFKETMEVNFRGQSCRVYVFTFTSEENSRNRVAVVGMFSENPAERSFLDEGLINYTSYSVSRRRQIRKAKELVEEMEAW